ncbi:hypothetical protein [Clostridium gasigenes]|uniref:hypothetical protein n=1 Tax=Clostridium gasigenes TaxID=94869 RepID=UPI001C0D00FE|nr:hypothetical protein [Clostridium gasigenes]MBU3107148.1 hypothetical protein [Clostridium gasigenes]
MTKYRVIMKNGSEFYAKLEGDKVVDEMLVQINQGNDFIAVGDDLLINLDELISIEKL